MPSHRRIVNHMVNYNATQADEHLDSIFRALADPTRRAIIQSLAQEPARASALAKPFAMSMPAISRHLKVLEQASLVTRSISGRNHEFRLQKETLGQAENWLQEQQKFWEQSLPKLEQFIAKK